MAGHVLTLLIAARSAGATASLQQVLPLALLVLVAMGLPTSIAGWGPREGMAAWAFGAGGLGAEQGVATAVAYGVMVFVASLPGAALLVVPMLEAWPRCRLGWPRPPPGGCHHLRCGRRGPRLNVPTPC